MSFRENTLELSHRFTRDPGDAERIDRPMTTPTDVSDTSDEALAVQLECLRRMSPQERLRRTCSWSGQVRRMAFDAIRRRHSAYSEHEVRLKFIEVTYEIIESVVNVSSSP